jgi:hypothetical protein
MPCNHIKLPGGGYALVCGPKPRAKPCVSCGRPASLLCDYPVTRAGKTGTCDRSVCVRCSVPQGEGRDYCLAHAELAGKLQPQGELFDDTSRD